MRLVISILFRRYIFFLIFKLKFARIFRPVSRERFACGRCVTPDAVDVLILPEFSDGFGRMYTGLC